MYVPIDDIMNTALRHFYFQVKALQPVFTCSKLTIETLEQGVKYVQS